MIFQFRNETKRTPWPRWPAVALRVAKDQPIPSRTRISERVLPYCHRCCQPAAPQSGTGQHAERNRTGTRQHASHHRNPSRNGGEGPRCMETRSALVGSFVHRKAPPPHHYTHTHHRNRQHVLTRKGARVLFVRNYFQFTIIVFLT
jgi:hypothetical protein